MDLHELLYIFKKRLILIISLTLFGGAISGVFSTLFLTKMYTADISVIIGKNYSNSAQGETATATYNDILMYQKTVKTYSKIATTRTVASDVINKLSLNYSPNALLGSVAVVVSADTEFMTIRITSHNPEEAASIANQWAISLKEISKEIQGTDNVKIIDKALVPSSLSSPNLKRNILAGLLVGFVIAAAFCLLLEYLDTTIKSEDDVVKLINLSVLSSIPNFEIDE